MTCGSVSACFRAKHGAAPPVGDGPEPEAANSNCERQKRQEREATAVHHNHSSACGLCCCFHWTRHFSCRRSLPTKVPTPIPPALIIDNIVEEIFTTIAKSDETRPPLSLVTPNLVFFVAATKDVLSSFRYTSEIARENFKSVECVLDGTQTLKDTVHRYCNEDDNGEWFPPWPFVSLDVELVNAIAMAKSMIIEYSTCRFSVGCVDMRTMQNCNMVSVNHLRRRLSLNTDPIYDSRLIAWARIPSEAIVFKMPCSELVMGDMGTKWFPPLARPEPNGWKGKHIQMSWRNNPGPFVNPGLDFGHMFCYLYRMSGRVDKEVTKQLVATFIGWSRCILRNNQWTPVLAAEMSSRAQEIYNSVDAVLEGVDFAYEVTQCIRS
ncbi:hypothetical protein BDV95DRAFT_63306 [Massariosphaeria phaeospora]|uniref:Uncharacterized protein n=1 Tax=Massariosphaeria phaeospora TaxID=100035 RepID=A0A7C8I6J2_9PLEO|nr:hypothetical protein BDV95DRAFT_63306 [Massariosphaeria phaeospora]